MCLVSYKKVALQGISGDADTEKILWTQQGKERVGPTELNHIRLPGGSEVKVSACSAGDLRSIPGSGRFPWRRKWQPRESQGRKSLVGYSPWGRKESDTTERLHFTPPGGHRKLSGVPPEVRHLGGLELSAMGGTHRALRRPA